MNKVVLAAAMLMASLGAAPFAHAAVDVEIAPPSAQLLGFVFPVVAAVKGQGIEFVQADGANPHNIVSAVSDGDGGYKILYGPDGAPWCAGVPLHKCPLFRSGPPVLGVTTQHMDLRNATVGSTYSFFCELHQYMLGQLRVLA